MPVMLHESDYAKWLDRSTTSDPLAKLLKPYPKKVVFEPFLDTA
jgi:putative SOS response-associated peptidase YedK